MANDNLLPWDPADSLHTRDDMVAYLEAAFEDGHPLVIAAVLDDVARAARREGLADDASTDAIALIVRLKTLGFELTAKAA